MLTNKANRTKNRSAWRFTRHYIEMVIAMFAGNAGDHAQHAAGPPAAAEA